MGRTGGGGAQLPGQRRHVSFVALSNQSSTFEHSNVANIQILETLETRRVYYANHILVYTSVYTSNRTIGNSIFRSFRIIPFEFAKGIITESR